ncbi:MAG: Bd3614 family nucleic acid deaminase [Panacagrimonas sp.]
MDVETFRNANIAAYDKSNFVNAFNDWRSTKKLAFFEKDKVLYIATDDDKTYDPVFKLCGAGFKDFHVTTNYAVSSASALGALLLHGATNVQFKPTVGNSFKFAKGSCMEVGLKVAGQLKLRYPVLPNTSPIVSDIQSEAASVMGESGTYMSCGMRTVHRLYLATAFVILRKLKGSTRDGVVAMIVDRNGRIISWGRKNNAVPCWHGETSAIIGLGGKIPKGSCVYSTLKPCNMCSGLIHDASGGDAKVFWGQDDPGSMATNTVLERMKMGRVLDGNKSHDGARAILLGAKTKTTDTRLPMATRLSSSFNAQKKGGMQSTIDYIVTDSASTIIKEAERVLKSKHEKYRSAPTNFNENTAFVVRYLTDFMVKLGLSPEGLGT